MADWEAAYQLHAPAIRGYLRRRLPRAADAEDLCQETFTRVLERDVQLRDPDRVRSYLMRAAHNLLVNHLRRPKLEQPHAELPEQVDPAGAEAAEEELYVQELEQSLERGLRGLSSRQRQIFERAVLQREPYASIAQDLGVSLSTIKVSVFRSRQALCSLLDSREDSDATL